MKLQSEDELARLIITTITRTRSSSETLIEVKIIKNDKKNDEQHHLIWILQPQWGFNHIHQRVIQSFRRRASMNGATGSHDTIHPRACGAKMLREESEPWAPMTIDKKEEDRTTNMYKG